MIQKQRNGFTILETVLALTLLMFGAMIVGEVAGWSIQERSRIETRLTVLEWAANQLEETRLLPWNTITAEWARTRSLPVDLVAQMNSPNAIVSVDTDESRPGMKRISVTVRWLNADGTATQPVSLSAWLSAREKAQ